MYDYGRVDKNGKRRELHIQKALEAANLKGSGRPVQPMRVLRYRNGYASELLCRCKYFEVQRIVMNTERCRQMAYYQSDRMSFRVLLCIGVLLMDDGDTICFFKGDCIFFPAASVRVRLHGKAEFLDVRG
jgi:mannose-6-phosphate isomerase